MATKPPGYWTRWYAANKERLKPSRRAAQKRYRGRHREAIMVAEMLDVPIAVARALLTAKTGSTDRPPARSGQSDGRIS